MDDEKIVRLFNARDEAAISGIKRKYGALIRDIAWNALGDNEDVKECENDVYMALWDSIPPNHPLNLRAFTCRIAKNLSLKKWRFNHTDKRTAMVTSYDELENSLGSTDVWKQWDNAQIGDAIVRFLQKQERADRQLFVCHFYYGENYRDLAARVGMSKNQLTRKMTQMQEKLKEYLRQEAGYEG